MEYLIKSFLSSATINDERLKSRMNKELRFRNDDEMKIFLRGILVDLDISLVQQKSFLDELISNCEHIDKIKSVRNFKLVNSNISKDESMTKTFHLNIVRESMNGCKPKGNVCYSDNTKNKNGCYFETSWYIALRALCLTIMSAEWHKTILLIDNIPLSIILVMKMSQLRGCSFYLENTISKNCEFIVRDVINSNYHKNMKELKIDTNARKQFFNVKRLKEKGIEKERILGKRKTGNTFLSYSLISMEEKFKNQHSLSDISLDTVKYILLMYLYTESVFDEYKINLKDNYGFNYLSNPCFVFSYVLMYIFRKGMFNYHKEQDIPLLYLNNEDAFEKIEEIAETIRGALENSTLEQLVTKEQLERFNIEKTHEKLQNKRILVNENKWQCVNIRIGNVDQLKCYLIKNCMVLEYEYLEKFMFGRNSKDFILVKFEEIINCFELEVSIKALIKEEQGILECDNLYFIIKMFDNEVCMIIYEPLLYLLRDISYSHVYGNANRAILNLPMYPNYMYMLYSRNKVFERKQCDPKLAILCSNAQNISLRAVIKIVLSWVSGRKKLKKKVLQISDPIFCVYERFTDIIERWESPDILIDSLNYGHRQYGSNESSILSAILGFILLREDHYIEKSVLHFIHCVFEKRKRYVKEAYPDLYKFYDTLYNLNQRSSDDLHRMTIPAKSMAPLWQTIENDDKYAMPWVYTYLLCCSDLVTDKEARIILCGIRPLNMPEPVEVVPGREVQEILSVLLGVYFTKFGKPYNRQYNGLKIPTKEVVDGTCKTSLVCYLFRSLEWVSLHDEKDRGYMYQAGNDLLGPTNVDPYDLFHTPSLFPIAIENNQLKYSDESLFIKKYQRNVLSDDDQLLLNLVLTHFKFVADGIATSKYSTTILQNNDAALNIQFSRALHKCALGFAKKMEREYYNNNNAIDLNVLLTPAYFQYIADTTQLEKRNRLNSSKVPQKFELDRLQNLFKIE